MVNSTAVYFVLISTPLKTILSFNLVTANLQACSTTTSALKSGSTKNAIKKQKCLGMKRLSRLLDQSSNE